MKPIDEAMIAELAKEHRLIVTLEENVASGGFGEKVRDCLDGMHTDCSLLTVSIPDEYVEHGNVSILYEEVGIDEESVTKRVMTAYASVLAEHRMRG